MCKHKCILSFLIAVGLAGCTKSGTDTFAEMNKAFGLTWPKDIQQPLAKSWKYRSALEGLSSTRVILAKVVLTDQQYQDFLLLNKGRTAPTQMDGRPPELRQYSNRCSWWDLDKYDSYTYFHLPPLASEGSGHLQAFITSTKTNHCIFLVGQTK